MSIFIQFCEKFKDYGFENEEQVSLKQIYNLTNNISKRFRKNHNMNTRSDVEKLVVEYPYNDNIEASKPFIYSYELNKEYLRFIVTTKQLLNNFIRHSEELKNNNFDKSICFLDTTFKTSNKNIKLATLATLTSVKPITFLFYSNNEK
jgi:hypothetical protein